MNRAVLGALCLILIGPVSTTAAAAGDAAAGRLKFESCRGCHAIAGYRNAYPDYGVPRLFGQQPDYLVAALKAYRAGRRDHPTMQAQAASLSDQDIQDIAAYLAGRGRQ
ncbi:cytochrome c [Salinisphaera sp. Q1T1-3]|uniref:c-type cytochrome n=1 Tax=Salinisphaera sp. Q1T1-3 TaxID=2321229 RepID=UPI000E75AB78|nr:cytochrome c [Salinisphaera sp. Q1T1-3]RJS92889.1 cytochrome c [Salinisphaera sp. Q1T1-3]